MDRHRNIACKLNCCGPCPIADSKEGFENGTMLPEKYKFVTDGRVGKMVLNDINGVGTGRKFYSQPNSDCAEMPKAWPSSQQTNQCASPLDQFNYLGDMEPAPQGMRQAVPGGGKVLNHEANF